MRGLGDNVTSKIIFAICISVFISAKIPVKKSGDVKFSPLFRSPFKSPVFMEEFPIRTDGATRLYAIAEKKGIIWLASEKTDTQIRYPLLDIRKQVLSQGWEEGLLGFTFDKNFSRNRRLYIFYCRNSPRRTVISRITFTKPVKDSNGTLTFLGAKFKEEMLIAIKQPFANHNGGMLAFGPDGNLYAGSGDGGSGGDPRGYGQNTSTLLGKILRINVNSEKGYNIPPGNMFADGKNGKPEIFALGLRNPWRFSFSPKGQLIVGDVGQNDYEEISIVIGGENHGWNIMEGFHCFKPSQNCNQQGLTLPVLEYDHSEGSSILGGYVYRGGNISWLKGQYVFADSMNGKIWMANLQNAKPEKKLIAQGNFLWSSFAENKQGDLFILDLTSGNIYTLADDKY